MIGDQEWEDHKVVSGFFFAVGDFLGIVNDVCETDSVQSTPFRG